MIDLNKLAAELHEAAVEKGFWDVEDAYIKHVAKMISELGEVVQADRAGIMYQPEDSISGKPEGVAVELADFVMMLLDLCVQCGVRLPDAPVSEWVEDRNENYILDTQAWELVCALNCELVAITDGGGNVCKLIAAVYEWLMVRDIDLWEIIRQKMKVNANREKLHGRLY